MTRVLLIGIKASAVDTRDPDLPPGLTTEKIAAGIEAAMADMKARGWEPGSCAILPDASAEAAIAASLAEPWDCVVIGGGIRMPASQLMLFERVINAVHRGAPGTADRVQYGADQFRRRGRSLAEAVITADRHATRIPDTTRSSGTPSSAARWT